MSYLDKMTKELDNIDSMLLYPWSYDINGNVFVVSGPNKDYAIFSCKNQLQAKTIVELRDKYNKAQIQILNKEMNNE